MKILNLILAILFLLFAIVQYNDPDPLFWIVIYLYAATFCFLFFRGRFYRRFILTGLIFYLCYAAYLFFAEDGVLDWLGQHDRETIVGSMKAEKPWIEQTREFFGLLILSLTFLA